VELQYVGHGGKRGDGGSRHVGSRLDMEISTWLE
jgi:hypothetical protein